MFLLHSQNPFQHVARHRVLVAEVLNHVTIAVDGDSFRDQMFVAIDRATRWGYGTTRSVQIGNGLTDKLRVLLRFILDFFIRYGKASKKR